METGTELTISAYETGPPRETQWWTDEGIYLGYSIAPPSDEAHPLRSKWELTGKTTRYRQDRHIVTIGPNGSGKTRRLLFPNLYFLKNWSIVAIDPKAELFAATAMERAKTPGHRIVLIDPFGVAKSTYPHLAERFSCESCGFNPIAVLDPASVRFIDDVKSLAIALIQSESEREKYWSQAAQALVKGLIMAQRLFFGPTASLALLRDALGQPPEDLADYNQRMVGTLGDAHPELRASLSEFLHWSPEDRELGGIRRTAKVQTDWLGSPPIREDLKKGAFDFASLKKTPTTVYLVLPPEFLASHAVWLRLMVASTLRPLLRSVEDNAVPVLFMLDEFAQLGHMEIVEDNYALMRGYGVKLWTIFQDLNQAKILYKESWESFISNAGMVQSFAPQDMTTRKYLSQLADERLTWHTRKAESGSFSIARAGPSYNTGGSTSDTHIKEPLMYPYELGQMSQGQAVIFTQRGAVMRAYFPDATAVPGVKEMMAEAAENMRP